MDVSSACSEGGAFPDQTSLKANIQDNRSMVKPVGEISKSFGNNRNAKTVWSIRSNGLETWQGTLWVNLVIPKDDNSTIDIPLAAVPLRTEFNTFLGLSESQINRLAAGIAIFGLLLIVLRILIFKKEPAAQNNGVR